METSEQMSLEIVPDRKRRSLWQYYKLIAESYKNGLSVKACAREYDVDKKVVKRVLAINNIPIRPQEHYQPVPTVDDITKQKIILEYTTTPTTKPELKEKYKLSLNIIKKIVTGHRAFDKRKLSNRTRNGYIFVPTQNHPRASYKDGRTLEHILVAEQKIGREITTNEQVHHIDLNKSNNHPNNLAVLTHKQHGIAHGSMFPILQKLIELEIVQFSNKTKKYYINKDWTNWYQQSGHLRFLDRENNLLPTKTKKKLPLFIVKNDTDVSN